MQLDKKAVNIIWSQSCTFNYNFQKRNATPVFTEARCWSDTSPGKAKLSNRKWDLVENAEN